MALSTVFRILTRLPLPPSPFNPPAGARRIIRWQIKHVYSVGTTARHPANRRVKAWVYLRDLQEQYGLTGAGGSVCSCRGCWCGPGVALGCCCTGGARCCVERAGVVV